MLTKVLFTMLVIIIVGMVFKSQTQSRTRTPPRQQRAAKPAPEKGSLAPRTVAYLLVGLLIIVSGVVYYFNWQDNHQVVTLRVINAAGTLSEYQAYRKDIQGREFTSIDGIRIQLADSDRLEILVKN